MNERGFSLFPSGLGIRQRIRLEANAAQQLRPVGCISQAACELMLVHLALAFSIGGEGGCSPRLKRHLVLSKMG